MASVTRKMQSGHIRNQHHARGDPRNKRIYTVITRRANDLSQRGTALHEDVDDAKRRSKLQMLCLRGFCAVCDKEANGLVTIKQTRLQKLSPRLINKCSKRPRMETIPEWLAAVGPTTSTRAFEEVVGACRNTSEPPVPASGHIMKQRKAQRRKCAAFTTKTQISIPEPQRCLNP